MSSSSTATVMITTEASNNIDGITYPSSGGYYTIDIDLYNNNNPLNIFDELYTDFYFMKPIKLAYLEVFSISKSQNQLNIFQFLFRPTANLHAYSATTAGRIQLEFPTIDSSGASAFPANLGYSG